MVLRQKFNQNNFEKIKKINKIRNNTIFEKKILFSQ